MTPARAGLALCAVVAVWGLILACSSAPKPVAAGGDCFQATDCQEGLVCAPDMSGKRTCTSDLTGIQKVPMMPGADAGPRRDATSDAPSDAPVMMMMDTSVPPVDSAADTAVD